MQFGLTETQQTLKNTVRKFLSAECPMAEVRRLLETDTAFDAGLWSKMAEQGWTGIIFPEAYGGFGMGMVEMAAALEEMGRALLPGPYLSTITAGALLEHAASDAHKHEHLSAICHGEAKATIALLEQEASWSPDAVAMRASSSGSRYQLSGQKLFVSDAAVADFIICAARLDGDLALLLAPKGNFRATLMPAMDGTRKLYEVTFDSLPAEALLARGPKARQALERALDISTVALVSEMVGGMQRLLDLTVEYAKTRKQFGKPIGSFQAVQQQCADMLVFTESSRSAVYYAAWTLQEGTTEVQSAVSTAKAYASEAFREVGNRAIQVHGGMGFTWENDCHLYYRRAKASEIAFGDATYHRERIARLVVDPQRVRVEDGVAAVV
jgi:alkylation response protein AidB-like acyl-CoA dehydrogenase